MMLIELVLLVLGFVLFALSAANVPGGPRFNPLAAGLACWLLAYILEHFGFK